MNDAVVFLLFLLFVHVCCWQYTKSKKILSLNIFQFLVSQSSMMRFLLLWLYVSAVTAQPSTPSLIGSPTAMIVNGAVRISVGVNGATSSTLTVGLCSITDHSTRLELTRTIDILTSTCGLEMFNCSHNDTGRCAGFNGTYLYTGALTLTSTFGISMYQLLDGQLNVLVPVSVRSDASDQPWLQIADSAPTNTPPMLFFDSTLAPVDNSPTDVMSIGSLVGYMIHITTPLPVDFDVIAVTALYCSSDGTSCASEAVPYWALMATEPPSAVQISNGPSVITLPASSNQTSFIVWVSFVSLPLKCKTTPMSCLPGNLTLSTILAPNLNNLPLPLQHRRLLAVTTQSPSSTQHARIMSQYVVSMSESTVPPSAIGTSGSVSSYSPFALLPLLNVVCCYIASRAW